MKRNLILLFVVLFSLQVLSIDKNCEEDLSNDYYTTLKSELGVEKVDKVVSKFINNLIYTKHVMASDKAIAIYKTYLFGFFASARVINAKSGENLISVSLEPLRKFQNLFQEEEFLDLLSQTLHDYPELTGFPIQFKSRY